MDNILLNDEKRIKIYNEIKNILLTFNKNSIKRGIYIYGNPGTGKTLFIKNLLKDLNYDMIYYDGGDIRNKILIDNISSDNISNCNVLSLMKHIIKKKVIIMDEIESINNSDRGGLSSLIKLIRYKKTKKQKLENTTNIPIICIGNYCFDKKIKELMKICYNFELKPFDNKIMYNYISKRIFNNNNVNIEIINNIIIHIGDDLRKLNNIINLINYDNNFLLKYDINLLFCKKQYNENIKKITHNLLYNKFDINKHSECMNETERTTVGLLWHENIIDNLFNNNNNTKQNINIYLKLLNNFCYADYIDRITFQYQIWLFNEISSLIKTFYNNYIYQNYINELNNKISFDDTQIRFTKILTKYSTEYNNILFINKLCMDFDMDKKDLITFFYYFDDNNINMINNYDKLDYKRMLRYLNKNIKKEDLLLNDDIDIYENNELFLI